MKFQKVVLSSLGYVLPADIVTSADIESELSEVYDRLGLPEGRLELMTGIRERRFFPPGSKPGPISALAAKLAVEQSGIPQSNFGALIHGSVCRDQMEPATANLVHYEVGLPANALVLDVSNACLGLLNGAVMLAQMIELGQIQAGVVVGAELGRSLVEGTIDSLKHDSSLTRKTIKPAFASLTIGSAAAAMVLCHRDLAESGSPVLGGSWMCDTAAHRLCAGGEDSATHGDSRPRMETDSEALLHAGITLAKKNWAETKTTLGWEDGSAHRVVTHQVGKAHQKLLLEGLGIPEGRDFPIYDRFGNTGSAALPLSLAMGIEAGALEPGMNIGLLGIGSGLNSLMLGLNWQSAAVAGATWSDA